VCIPQNCFVFKKIQRQNYEESHKASIIYKKKKMKAETPFHNRIHYNYTATATISIWCNGARDYNIYIYIYIYIYITSGQLAAVPTLTALTQCSCRCKGSDFWIARIRHVRSDPFSRLHFLFIACSVLATLTLR
jgi:hypothetical protein